MWRLLFVTLIACAGTNDNTADPAPDVATDLASAGDTSDSGDTADDASDSGATEDTGDTSDAGDAQPEPDVPDAGDTPSMPYGHVPPPQAEVSPVLRADTWKTHYIEDIQPYWTHPAALGEPAGNFPSWRGMSGAVAGPSTRRPRMIARQVYTYAMGYALTGNLELLGHAALGVRWLQTKAVDPRGGCHAQLDANGDPVGNAPKTAQDQAYCALGFAAWFFVTGDPAAEAQVLAIRDLLMEPGQFWDPVAGRILDGRTADMGAEVDLEDDGGWELVAQLDAVNAFMLLVQPALSDPERRDQFLADLRALGEVMIREFYADGTFWGVHNQKGQYGSRHADFGHGLKTYWMLLQIDKRLPDHPFKAFLEREMPAAIDRAFDRENGRWAKRPTGPNTVEYGSDWWVYAEADQAAATWNLRDHARTGALERSWAAWRRDYVDRTRAVREVVPSIDRDGAWVWNWTDEDNAKCNQWKNGFHSTEHALVGYLLGSYLEDKPATLHFAPIPAPENFRAYAYIFQSTESAREASEAVTVHGIRHTPVQVRFRGLW